MSGGLSIEPGAAGLVRVETADGSAVAILSRDAITRLNREVQSDTSDGTVTYLGVTFDEADLREVYQASVRSLRAVRAVALTCVECDNPPELGSRCRSCAARKWSE